MPVEKRTYAQGAQGESPSNTSAKPSLFRRLRYTFDNAVVHNSAFMVFLLVGSAVLAILTTAISYANGDDPTQDARWLTKKAFIDRLWFVFTQIVFGGGKPDGTGLDRVLAAVLWTGNVLFTAFLFSYVTVKLFEILAKIQKGRSAVIDANHTLILGWSNRVFPLLKELNTANAGRKGSVVIMSDKERSAMDIEIQSRVGDLKNLKLVSRSGDISNPADLSRVNVNLAKSIILLDSQGGSDANVVATVLAAKASGAAQVPVIAEVDSAKIGLALRTATEGQVIPVRSDEIIARVTAQASRQVGLGAVVLDLLDFDGDEMYFTNVPALEGKTYGEALLSFNNSSVIGLFDSHSNIKINPATSARIAKGDRIVVIAEDDTKVVYTGIRDDLLKRVAKRNAAVAPKVANLLVIGWSSMGDDVLTELAAYLPKGSTVQVAAHSEFVKADTLKGKKWGALKVTHKFLTGASDELVALTKGQKFDEIIVLGYREGISAADADAHTMLTMLQLNQLSLKAKSGEPTRLISEILDSRKAELARVAAEGDLVISDNLGALLIAQLSENPQLALIFDDLFGPGGSSILVNPIENYAAVGKSVTFAELVAAAADRGESAIGFRAAAEISLDGSTGVVLNPGKNQNFVPKTGDSLVVIGKF